MRKTYAKLSEKFTRFATTHEVWDFPIISPFSSLTYKYKHRSLIFKIVIFFQRLSESFEFRLFEELLEPGMRVVDIGANLGLYTVEASKKVSPSGRVFSFEPEPSTHKVLQGRLADLKQDNVTLYPRALSDKKGKQKLYLDEVNVGGHSFSKNNTYRGNSYLEVEAMTLDEHFGEMGMLDKIDLIKIDTQGSEGLVFMGGKKLIKRSRPIVLMEFWPYGMKEWNVKPKELLRFFADLGYTIEVINKVKRKTVKTNVEDVVKKNIPENGKNDYVDLLLVPGK